MPRLARQTLVGIALFASLLLTACGAQGPKLHPVRGKLFYQNQPAEGAVVVFQPAGSTDATALKPSGTVAADGSFSLHTHPYGEGAPAGEYIVLVTWYPEDARSMDNPTNRLPAKYADPQAALLKATVQDGPTDLEPFRLK